MESDDQNWVALIDPRFSLLELNSGRGRHPIQYLDTVTGWRGDLALRLREALDRPVASAPHR
jgi:hypothetical protein